MSPGGALVRRLRLDCALAGEWGGGEGNEQGEEGGGDLTTQPDAELRPYPVPLQWPPHGWRRGLPWASHFHVTGDLPKPGGADAYRCPGRALPKNARLPSYLTCKAREPRHQRPD